MTHWFLWLFRIILLFSFEENIFVKKGLMCWILFFHEDKIFSDVWNWLIFFLVWNGICCFSSQEKKTFDHESFLFINIFSGDVSFSNWVKTASLLFQEKKFLFDFFRVSDRNYCVEFSGGQKIFTGQNKMWKFSRGERILWIFLCFLPGRKIWDKNYVLKKQTFI